MTECGYRGTVYRLTSKYTWWARIADILSIWNHVMVVVCSLLFVEFTITSPTFSERCHQGSGYRFILLCHRLRFFRNQCYIIVTVYRYRRQEIYFSYSLPFFTSGGRHGTNSAKCYIVRVVKKVTTGKSLMGHQLYSLSGDRFAKCVFEEIRLRTTRIFLRSVSPLVSILPIPMWHDRFYFMLTL